MDLLSEYEVIRKIGKGGFGEAWLYRHKSDKKECVIKKMRVDKESVRESAEREARLLCELKHPNVVSYMDCIITSDNIVYLVMEYCDGGDLGDRISKCVQSRTCLPETQIVEWTLDLCLALQYIHGLNILHRDLKPQNIFLTQQDVVKIGDFGIARELNPGDLATTAIGTPLYISPEVMTGNPYDSKVDVWSLGCCVYEMMTLRPALDVSMLINYGRRRIGEMPREYSSQLTKMTKDMLTDAPSQRPSINKVLEMSIMKNALKQRTDAEAAAAAAARPANGANGMLELHYNNNNNKIGRSTPPVAVAAGPVAQPASSPRRLPPVPIPPPSPKQQQQQQPSKSAAAASPNARGSVVPAAAVPKSPPRVGSASPGLAARPVADGRCAIVDRPPSAAGTTNVVKESPVIESNAAILHARPQIMDPSGDAASVLSCFKCSLKLNRSRYILRDAHPFCIKCYEAQFANKCEGCKKTIRSDSKDVSYKDKHWHEKCFKCVQCKLSLVDQPFVCKDEKKYCSKCYEDKFAVRCDACLNVFRDGMKKYEFNGKQFHLECFCCKVCRQPIGVKSFIQRDQQAVCMQCYEKQYAKRCVKCNGVINGKGITFKGSPWHAECLTCNGCNKMLAGEDFTSRDEKPYCVDCFAERFGKKCVRCTKPITGLGTTKFMSFDGRHWHTDCFRCYKCKASLNDGRFIYKEPDVLCPNCAHA